MTERHVATFTVPAEHPALPGHFPGTPVVPGVVVLDHVLHATEQWQGRAVHVGAIRQVKFHSPLLPGEMAEVTLDFSGAVLAFRVVRSEQLIAQGTFGLADAAPPP
jgi:3-hydroxymyristoyl/3-hydroxydecanoyl-(acyl carrier protein) dehydratase